MEIDHAQIFLIYIYFLILFNAFALGLDNMTFQILF